MGAPVGNQNAVKENRRFSEALNRAIAQDDSKRLRESVEKLLDKAAAGEPWALNMLGDRLDGKPAQAIVGADGGNLKVEVVTGVPEG